MKNQIKFPELEADLKAQLDSNAQKVRIDAAADGKRNLPGIDEDLGFYYESHHYAYNKCIALIYSTLQMGSKCIAVLEATELYVESHLKLDNAERIIRGRIVDVKQTLKGQTAIGNVRWMLIVGAFALGIFDGLFNQPFFEFKGAFFLFSLMCSLIFGGGLFVLAHVIIPRIQLMKDKQQAKYYWVMVGGSLLLLFHFMAKGRLHATGGALSNGEALPFTLLSLVMFALSCFLSHLYRSGKHPAQHQNMERTKELKDELKTLENELKKIQKQREELKQKEQEEREYARSVFEYATGLRQWVIDEAYQSYFSYKKINRLNRTDQAIPMSFHYNEYPFEFSSFFEMSKEKPPFRSVTPFITLLFVSLLGLFACDSPAKDHFDTSLTVLVDTTDPLLVYPDTTQIKNLLNIQDNMWQGVEVNISTITDKDINLAQTVTLPKANRLTSRLQTRQEQVADFNVELFHFIDACRPGESKNSLGHSIVFRTLARQLAMLRESTSKNKYLVVYSNLYENSDLANFYDPSTLKKLQDNPKEIQQKFEDAVPLGDLSGITVWFIYQPESYTDNLRYITVSSFFKKLFQDHEGTVHVVASL